MTDLAISLLILALFVGFLFYVAADLSDLIAQQLADERSVGGSPPGSVATGEPSAAGAAVPYDWDEAA